MSSVRSPQPPPGLRECNVVPCLRNGCGTQGPRRRVLVHTLPDSAVVCVTGASRPTTMLARTSFVQWCHYLSRSRLSGQPSSLDCRAGPQRAQVLPYYWERRRGGRHGFANIRATRPRARICSWEQLELSWHTSARRGVWGGGGWKRRWKPRRNWALGRSSR